MRHLRFTWRGGRDSFTSLITNSPAFQFDMSEIARIREEMTTLVDNLSKVYLSWLKKQDNNANNDNDNDNGNNDNDNDNENGNNDNANANDNNNNNNNNNNSSSNNDNNIHNNIDDIDDSNNVTDDNNNNNSINNNNNNNIIKMTYDEVNNKTLLEIATKDVKNKCIVIGCTKVASNVQECNERINFNGKFKKFFCISHHKCFRLDIGMKFDRMRTRFTERQIAALITAYILVEEKNDGAHGGTTDHVNLNHIGLLIGQDIDNESEFQKWINSFKTYRTKFLNTDIKMPRCDAIAGVCEVILNDERLSNGRVRDSITTELVEKALRLVRPLVKEIDASDAYLREAIHGCIEKMELLETKNLLVNQSLNVIDHNPSPELLPSLTNFDQQLLQLYIITRKQCESSNMTVPMLPKDLIDRIVETYPQFNIEEYFESIDN